MSLTLALLVTYSALLVAIGVWVGRRVRAGGDFFVAGRNLSAGLIFSTFLAANIGAGSTVGATSLGYTAGLSAWWWNGSAALGTLALAFWIGPRMWREAKAHGDLTVGDFLERYYGPGLRRLVALLIWIGTLSILAAQLIGVAAVLQVVGGFPLITGAAIGAAVTAAYFVAGGLLSSAWVNFVQLIVILAGFAIVAPLAVGAAGGWTGVASLPASRLDFFGGDGAPGWRYIFMLGPAFIISPGLLQKAYGARDEGAVRTGLAWTGLAMLAFAAAPPLIGMSRYAIDPTLPAADLALPTLLTRDVPPFVGALALAAVFSAEISSADAVLFMLATSASRDLYRGVFRPQASDAELLNVARLAAVFGAVLGVGLAVMHKSVIDAVQTFYSLLVVVLFVPVLGALFVRGVGRREGLASVLLSVPTLVMVQLATSGKGYGILTPTLAGVLAGAVSFAAVRLQRR